MNRLFVFAALTFTMLLAACAGSAPTPEPGMKVVEHGYGEEMQLAAGVDWNDYTKIILHTAPVAFTENWRSNQERMHGKEMRDEDVERIQSAVSGHLSRVLYRTLSERGGYELTSESGPGVMEFQPNIVELDIQATGWVQNSILESLPDNRGSMTVELVIRDSVSDELIGVGWQNLNDPRRGDMEMTSNVNNTQAIRLMAQDFANWLRGVLDDARDE